MKSPQGLLPIFLQSCETNPARQTQRDKPCETNPPYDNTSSRRGWTWQLWWYHSIQNDVESFPWYLQQSNYTRKNDIWDIPVIPKILAVWDLVKPSTQKCFFHKTNKFEWGVNLALYPCYPSQGLSHSFGEISDENPGRISHVIWCHLGSYVKVAMWQNARNNCHCMSWCNGKMQGSHFDLYACTCAHSLITTVSSVADLEGVLRVPWNPPFKYKCVPRQFIYTARL